MDDRTGRGRSGRWRALAVGLAVGLGLGVVGVIGVVGRSAAASEAVSWDRSDADEEAQGAGVRREIRAVVVLVVLTDPRPGAAGFPAGWVDAVEAALRRVYQVEVRRVAARPLPRSAYRSARKRYRADDLLVYLGSQIPAELPAGTRVLGLTSADISTTKEPFKDWGVFGLGEIGGRAAMVSSHRLRRKARAAQVQRRVVNTAVHELGHVLGLDHCEEANCVMLDAQGGIANTDASSGALGVACAARLDRAAPLRPAGALLGTARGRAG